MHLSKNVSIRAAEQTILWTGRALVCAVLMIAPWPYGMAEWSAQVWLVPAVLCILATATIHLVWRKLVVANPLLAVLSVLLAVALLQTVPLPKPVWNALSASARFDHESRLLAETFSDDFLPDAEQADLGEASVANVAGTGEAFGIPIAPTISIHPLQTLTSASVFALGLAMLFSCCVLFRDKRSVSALLGSLSLAGVAVSCLGIYQSIVAGDWSLLEGISKDTSFATFFSRNSAPQFLACGFAATCGFLTLYRAREKSDRDNRYQITYPSVNFVARLRRYVDDLISDADLVTALCLLFLAIQFIAIITANSRGGILSFCLSGSVVLCVYALGKQASAGASLGVLLLILCAGLFLSSFGLEDKIVQRINTLSEDAHDLKSNSRFQLWQTALSQPNAWLLGSGFGTFHFAVLPAYAKPQPTWYYHAENIFVELASNTGVTMLLLVLGGAGWLLWRLLTNQSKASSVRASRFACMFSVLAVLLQNLVDFSLILPAIFLPLAAMTGAFLGSCSEPRRKVKVKVRRQTAVDEEVDQYTALKRVRRKGSAKLRSGKHRNAEAGTATLNARPERDGGLGVERASGFGNSEHRNRNDTNAEPTRRLHWPTIVILMLILLAIFAGRRSLAAFAFSEQLRNNLNISSAKTSNAEEVEKDDVKSLDEAIHTLAEKSQRWGGFPEMHLQLGRFRQELAAAQLQSSSEWPSIVMETQRRALSRPEFFTSAFHRSGDPELQELRKFVEQQPEVVSGIVTSADDMKLALAACPLDWRAYWGLLRADIGEMTAEERRLNYARLLMTCRNNQPVLQSAATHALISGETKAGLQILKELLPVSVIARKKIPGLLGSFLTVEQLLDAYPQGMFDRIELAIDLDRLNLQQFIPQVLETIDLGELETALNSDPSDYQKECIDWASTRKDELPLTIEVR